MVAVSPGSWVSGRSTVRTSQPSCMADHAPSKLMQSNVMQLDFAIALLKTTGDYMREYCDTGFDKAIEVASEVASRFDDPVETNFEIEKRTRRKKQCFYYEGADDPVIGAEKKIQN
ncbi:hypothetical protein NDU88_003925 [Pleurodeles waltl]|uniref:Uncharacterized protein n=1 Tax=Pleurodeles waltl TaxID=8319 RepID=A0AAV7LGL2_PLEWA|nr:hypothetical protein NDU88_003925 [Pleurodeles waltl]